MHLTCVEHGAMGSYAIVGAHLPIAAGAAWSAQLRGSGQVAVCFFGDGTTNIGAFHEALNAAAVWRLPVVFVCENNRYMEYTAIEIGHGRRPPGRRPGRAPTGSSRSSSTATTSTSCTPPRSRPSSAPAPATARASSRPRRIATAATRAPTPRRTARPRRSRPGWPATRSSPTAPGCSTRASMPRRSMPSRRRDAAGRRGRHRRGAGDARAVRGHAWRRTLWHDGGSAWRT